MPGVQGPIVVRFDEVVRLSRQAHLHGIVVDVLDRSPHVVGVVEEDFPSGASPDGVIERTESETAKPQAAGFLEVEDHFLGAVPVLANQKMDVVAHDDARVSRVPTFVNDSAERVSNGRDFGGAEIEQLVFQLVHGVFVEVPDVARRRLDALTTVVEFTKFA